MREDYLFLVVVIGMIFTTIVISRICTTIEAIKNGSKVFNKIMKEVLNDDSKSNSAGSGEVRDEQLPRDPDGPRSNGRGNNRGLGN